MPRNLVGVQATDTSVALTWTDDTAWTDGVAPADDYQVSRDGGATWLAAATRTGHTFAGLVAGTHTFHVRARYTPAGAPVAVPVSSASSPESSPGGEGPAQAIDGSLATKWLANASQPTLDLLLSAPAVVTTYRIASGNDDPNRDLKDWRLLGSADGGATWTTVDAVLAETPWPARQVYRDYVVDTPGTYGRYRLKVDANQASSLTQISEIVLRASAASAQVEGSTSSVVVDLVPTGPPSPYLAHLRVGSHVWDVVGDEDPAYGPLAGLRFSWAARQDDGWPTQHDPTLLVFGVVVEAGTDFDDVDQGTVVHFTFTPDGYATPLVEFGGTVRDLTATPHDRGMVYTITAVDHLQALREDYTVQAYIDGDSPSSLLWTEPLKDAGGAGMGEGIRPALVDPFVGDVIPYSLGGGFTGTDPIAFGDPTPEPAWNVLTGLLAQGISRLGVAGGPGHRGVLTYRLDGAGDLDAAQPYEGTWLPMGGDNAPLSFVEGPDGWTGAGGNVDGCLLRTDATLWARQRVEPNRAAFTGFLSGIVYERPHTGPDVTRYLNDDGDAFLSDVTDPDWIVAGVENADQWGTEFALLGWRDPAVVAGWFTMPTAMRVAVAAHSIAPRHTPSGSGTMAGMLAGAALLIPPGGRWEVRFRLRRTLPDPSGPWGVGVPSDAIAYDDLDPALTYDDLDPALTYVDTIQIGD